MDNPFEKLGIPSTSDPEEIHKAYRNLVKKCHPDIFHDENAQKQAEEKMIELNLAYEKALTIAKRTSSQTAAIPEYVSEDEAEKAAVRMLKNQSPEAALRQLNRTKERDASWYALQGKIFMKMEKFSDAHASFRQAVKMEPENNQYGRGALEAAMAMKRKESIFQKAAKKLRAAVKKIFRK